MLNALILDCEESTSKTLQDFLQAHQEHIGSIELADCLEDALRILEQQSIDLVFMNTDMPHKCIQTFFKAVDQFDFDIILTLGAENAALKAFKSPAIDVLLKPIDPKELEVSMNRLIRRNQQKKLARNSYKFKKLALPTSDGFAFVEIQQIIRCEASGNYSMFFTSSGQKILVSKTLKEYESLLQEHHFFRAHRSHLINLSYIRQYSKGRIPLVVLNDGTEISLSPSKRQNFLDLMLSTT